MPSLLVPALTEGTWRCCKIFLAPKEGSLKVSPQQVFTAQLFLIAVENPSLCAFSSLPWRRARSDEKPCLACEQEIALRIRMKNSRAFPIDTLPITSLVTLSPAGVGYVRGCQGNCSMAILCDSQSAIALLVQFKVLCFNFFKPQVPLSINEEWD